MIKTTIDWAPPAKAGKRPVIDSPGHGQLIFAIDRLGEAHVLSSDIRVYQMPQDLEEAELINACDLFDHSLVTALEEMADEAWDARLVGHGGVYRFIGTLTPEASPYRELKGRITTIVPGTRPEEEG